MNSPEKAVAEPDALKILLGDSLPSDVNVQMKVVSIPGDPQQSLTAAVLALLESRKSRISRYVFLASVQKQSVHYPICYARVRKPLSGCNLLLCAPDSADPTIRYSRVCSAIYYRNRQVFTTVRTSNHLEHESKRI